MRTMLVTNESSVWSDSQVQQVVAALQTQLDRDVAPRWFGATAQLVFGKPDVTKEMLHFIDTSDQASALGYHLDNQFGIPEGFVFIKTTLDDGSSPSSCASHEAIEQLIDALANITTPVRWAGHNAAIAYEVGDPVEADTYNIDGVPVSNFVLPNWFVPGSRGPYDFMGKLSAPLTMSSGGYVAWSDLRRWHQTFAPDSKAAKKLHIKHSRLARRLRRHP